MRKTPKPGDRVTIRMPDGQQIEATLGADVDLATEAVHDGQGRQIDDAYVARAVERARRPVGRPSLSGGRDPSPRVNFRVPDEVRDLAEERARREGKTLSALAREAFERYLRAG